MTGLDLSSRLPDPDAAYRALIEAHRGLSEAQSAALNTALVLLLANHVGSMQVLAEALATARETLGPARDQNAPASRG